MHFHAWPLGDVLVSVVLVNLTGSYFHLKISPKWLILFQVLHPECLTFFEAHSFRPTRGIRSFTRFPVASATSFRWKVSWVGSAERFLLLQAGQGIYTLPKANIAPEIRLPEKKVVFEPTIFRGNVDFREGMHTVHDTYRMWRPGYGSNNKNWVVPPSQVLQLKVKGCINYNMFTTPGGY